MWRRRSSGSRRRVAAARGEGRVVHGRAAAAGIIRSVHTPVRTTLALAACAVLAAGCGATSGSSSSSGAGNASTSIARAQAGAHARAVNLRAADAPG